jgi:hypothetical protein
LRNAEKASGMIAFDGAGRCRGGSAACLFILVIFSGFLGVAG